MSVKLRQELERRICTAVVDAALAAGYVIGVDNGGDDEEYRGTCRDQILSEMFATDQEHLFFYQTIGQKNANGWIFFVYGNDGHDVISDYTTNIESMLQPAKAIAEQYA